MRRGQRPTQHRLICAGALVFGALLAASSETVNEFTIFADPGKYEYHSCDQLAGQRKNLISKEQELQLLMGKAKQGTGGKVISAIDYQSDYDAVREEIKVIDATARIKKCKIQDDPQSNSA
jgi:hypothetical protein